MSGRQSIRSRTKPVSLHVAQVCNTSPANFFSSPLNYEEQTMKTAPRGAGIHPPKQQQQQQKQRQKTNKRTHNFYCLKIEGKRR